MSVVNARSVSVQINELRRLRTEAALWRYGALVLIAATVAICLITLNNSVRALTQAGPDQDAFTADLSSGLQKNVVPQLQEIAGHTLTELRPQVIAAFAKAQQRAPEIADKSQAELATLQKNIASRSQQTLNETFQKQLKDREPKIKAMYPNVTDDKIQTLVDNLSQIGVVRLGEANNLLLSRHFSAMTGIVTDMTQIQDAEKIDTKSSKQPTWDIATTLLSEVEKNVQGVTPAVEADKAAVSAVAGAAATTGSVIQGATK